MPSAAKVERVAKLKDRIEGSSALLLTEYRGLTVSEITDLRRTLREAGTNLSVVKNTLMQRAAANAGMAELGALLEGPSAVAFVGGDPVAAAKTIKAAAKLYPSLVLKGGHVIDPKNKINGVMDVAVTGGKIARVAANIPAT